MIQALKLVHKQYPKVKALWKIVRTPDNHAKEDLPFVKETGWLPSVEEVYEHPAVQIVVHHGGGKSRVFSRSALTNISEQVIPSTR
jgi:hypothetical protein